MRFSRILSRPLRRMNYAPSFTTSLMASVWIADYWHHRGDILYAIWFVLAAISLVIWPVATGRRLTSLGWSRWWLLAFAVPWALFLCVARWADTWWIVAALFVLVVANLPLLLIKGVTEDPELESMAIGEPRA